jgi:hypothetical protein
LSSSLCVKNGSGAHPASCPMRTGGKAWPGSDADHSPHLVPKLRMSRSYTYSPCVHGGSGTAVNTEADDNLISVVITLQTRISLEHAYISGSCFWTQSLPSSFCKQVQLAIIAIVRITPAYKHLPLNLESIGNCILA